MKYFLRVLLVLVLSAAIVCGVYYYQNGSLTPTGGERATLTTVSKPPATERVKSKKLLTRLKKDKIALYKTADGILLRFKGKEYTFDGFSASIEREKPQMVYVDADGDKEKEIIIRAVTGEDAATGKLLYSVYVLNPVKGDFEIAMAAQDTWFDVLSQYIRIDLRQLKLSNKFLQLSMISKERTIRYDKATGIAKNGHNGYARALQRADGTYAKLSAMEKGAGDFTLSDDGTISVSIELRAKYEGLEELQPFGSIYFEFSVDKNNEFYVTEKSMKFVPNEQYRVVKPTGKQATPFTYTEKNAAEDNGSGSLVWIQYTPAPEEDTIEQTVNLAEESTDIKHVARLEIDNRSLKLTAKKGYRFDTAPAVNGEFAVELTEGKDKGADIAYSAALSEDDTVLTVTLDRSYSADVLQHIEIRYGSR